MIIARAPLRVSFGGGGTDIPAYYRQFGGMVLSAAIDKYVYVMVSPSTDAVHLTSTEFGTVSPVSFGDKGSDSARLPLTVIQHCIPDTPLSVFISSEVQSGTGLGSSSTVAVALIRALDAIRGIDRSPAAVAALASTIELDLLGAPCGKQDQYASALGGINLLTFSADDSVGVEPLELTQHTFNALQQQLLLFFTGTRRDSASILSHQRRKSEEHDPRTLDALHEIKELTPLMRVALLAGDLDRFGLLLHRSWVQKRQVTNGISNAFIDHCYATALEAGALGGKITGAGGGGFLLVYVPSGAQGPVTTALRTLGLAALPFRFARSGAQVLLNQPALDTTPWTR